MEKYTIIRDAGAGGTMFWYYHRAGIQSNVITTAKYASKDGQILTKPLVMTALRTVVQKQPQLRTVALVRPSGKDKRRHLIKVALLNEVDLVNCVEWVDDPTGRGVTSDLLDKVHNEWLYVTPEEPDKPWFKLIIVGERDVMFVYHHIVADGRAGYIFHHDFRDALNAMRRAPERIPSTVLRFRNDTEIPQSVGEIGRKCIAAGKPYKGSVLEVFRFFAFCFFLRLLTGSRAVFGDLVPVLPPVKAPLAITNKPEERTITRIETMRIPAPLMEKVLAACRKHETTFHPLLVTMLMVTMAVDFYPNAWWTVMRFMFDLRDHYPEEELGDFSVHGPIANLTAGFPKAHALGRYRKVALDSQGKKDDEEYAVDKTAAWDLIREYKDSMNARIGPGIRANMTGDATATDLESFTSQTLPLLDILMSHSTMVSNLGPLINPEGERAGNWWVEDTQFSAAATGRNQGSLGPIFNGAGVKGGDAVINACYCEGVASRAMVRGILDATLSRIETLVE